MNMQVVLISKVILKEKVNIIVTGKMVNATDKEA